MAIANVMVFARNQTDGDQIQNVLTPLSAMFLSARRQNLVFRRRRAY
jgi:hypothetical protein